MNSPGCNHRANNLDKVSCSSLKVIMKSSKKIILDKRYICDIFLLASLNYIISPLNNIPMFYIK